MCLCSARKNKGLMVLLCSVAFVHCAAGQITNIAGLKMDEYTVIDDFSADTSRFGTSWDGFTDQVMGGVSEMRVSRMADAEESFVRISGAVSTENNGGFIQIRLKLTGGGSAYDASAYEGLRLKARGIDDGYYIFLRTTSTILPWKFFKATIPVGEDWGVVEIPWSSFGSGDYGRAKKLKTSKLKSIALVAYGKSFNAQFDVSEIGFYK